MLKDTEKDFEIAKASSSDLRVFKKTSPNSILTLYLGTRDVICREGSVEPLRGVIYIDPKFVSNHKIFGQLTLTFRYGREDEEVMGLKFCNEAIISIKQIWPATDEIEDLSSLQQILIEKLGKSAHPFSLDVGTIAPPSVQLIPAKRYNGAPIGTSYDIRVHMADPNEERLQRRSMVRLGVRVLHKINVNSTKFAQPTPLITNQTSTSSTSSPSTTANSSTTTTTTTKTTTTTSSTLPKSLRLRLSPKALKLTNKFTNNEFRTSNGGGGGGGASSRIDKCSTDLHIENINNKFNSIQPLFKGPEGSVDKPFLWTEGRVSLRAALNKSAYGHGEHISVTIDIRNDSRKIIRKIRIFAVQHVDVCMFSNGKFKNVVADINENHQIKPGEIHRKVYSLLPIRGPTKNWIAVEGNPSISGFDVDMSNYNYKIASSAPRGPQTPDERNVFAIYVSYYIKVKLTLSGMGGEVSLKLPFILGHLDDYNNIPNIEVTTASSAAAVPTTTATITTTTTNTNTITAGISTTASEINADGTKCITLQNNNNNNSNNKSNVNKVMDEECIVRDESYDGTATSLVTDSITKCKLSGYSDDIKERLKCRTMKTISVDICELDNIVIDDEGEGGGDCSNSNLNINKNEQQQSKHFVELHHSSKLIRANEIDDDDDKINKNISITTVQIHQQQSNE